MKVNSVVIVLMVTSLSSTLSAQHQSITPLVKHIEPKQTPGWDSTAMHNVNHKVEQEKQVHYQRAIHYREQGKFKALLLRKLDWDKSKRHFQWVISRDSLYNDVLYQYALLLRYRERYQEAIQAGHAQIRLHPELIEPQVQLYRFYRYFITHTDLQKAVDWLAQQPWEQARYSIGEKFRREHKLNQADSIFQDVLNRSTSISKQPVYLSVARLYYEQNESLIAQTYYWRAVAEIKNQIDANLIFEDVKFILTDSEIQTYRTITSIPSKIEFFHTVWVQRDPTPAAPVNERLHEHYQRLLYAEQYYEHDGFRTQFNNPDVYRYLKFNDAYYLNQEFDDRGFIYIRHGPPDDKIVTVGENVPVNESWRYYSGSLNSDMIFHFLLENSVNFWRFAPFITNSQMLEDRVMWDNIYYQMLTASPLEQLSYINKMAQQNQEFVTAGITTDRHSWGKKMKPLEMFLSTATFRDKGDKTLLEVYYAIPLSPLVEQISTEKNEMEMERGCVIHDRRWKEIAKRQDRIKLPLMESRGFVDLYRFVVPPDSYQIALYVKSLDADHLGGYKVMNRIDDYSAPYLNMSSLQLASRIEPAQVDDKFIKNNLRIVPNPTQRYSHDRPVYIYFEIYNLNKNNEGHTHFTIDYSITLIKHRQKGWKRFMRLLGGGRSAITLRIDREGEDDFSVEYISLDVSKADAGDYELSVKVIDQNNGATVERSQKVYLF